MISIVWSGVNTARAEFININWAGSVNVLAGQAAVTSPDSIGAPIGQLSLSNFQSTTTYAGLSTLLGVSEAQLLQADLIAFDVQGVVPGQGAGVNNGFESVRFTAGDSQTSVTIDHDENLTALKPGVLATGTLTNVQFNAFFGVNTPFSNSWILLDWGNVPIDKSSAFFFVEATGGNLLGFGGEGSPDLDAVGLLNVSAVPEPSTAMLFFGTAIVLGYGRRHIRHRKILSSSGLIGDKYAS
jgi:hypothetical protein